MEFSKKIPLISESDLSTYVPSEKQLSDFDKKLQKIFNSDLQDLQNFSRIIC